MENISVEKGISVEKISVEKMMIMFAWLGTRRCVSSACAGQVVLSMTYNTKLFSLYIFEPIWAGGFMMEGRL